MDNIRMLFIRLFPYVGEIIGTAAIIITIILAKGSDQDKKSQRVSVKISVCLIILCVVFCWLLYSVNNNFCIMPDLYGTSYDNAIEMLRSTGLKGHLALASTSKNISNTNARVAYQSIQKEKIVPKQSEVYFVLDDCFALEYSPIISKNAPIPQTNWDWVLSDNNDNLIYLYLPLGYENTFSYYGASDQTELAIAGYTLSETLDEITENYVNSSGSCVKYKTEHYQFVGKFVRIDNDYDIRLTEYNSNNYQGVFFFPSFLRTGNYIFTFAFLDDTGEYLEHSCRVIVKNKMLRGLS